MPDTLTPPTPAADTGIAQGAPSTGARPSSFRPPNPAFDRVAASIKAKAGPLPAGAKPPPEVPTPEPAKAEPPKTVELPKVQDEPETPPEGQKTEDATPPKEGAETTLEAEPKKEKKVSPWRLLDEWKKTASDWKTKAETAEQELSRIKAGGPAEPPKDLVDRLKATEAKVKEYEDHLRFLDYQRHPEFVQKYQQPYEQAWKRATSELAEVAVTDPSTGAARPATAEDMLALVNLPLGKAREYANQIFGEFADDAMAHRKEIKSLFDAQQTALKEARENGAARVKQEQEQTQAQRAQLTKFVTETWTEANRAAVTDEKYGKYFTPIEGDQQGNASLAKGFELADKAFGKNPNDPNLSEAERKDIIRMHAALRNRAAAFGRLRQWVEQRDNRIAELEKELEDYKKSEPGTTSTSKPAQDKGVASDPWARIEQGIRKRASR